MSHIFISYSRHDDEITNKIVQYLHQHDIKTSLDQDNLKFGVDISETITKAVDTASAGILVLSISSANSPYIAREYRHIIAQNKFLYILKVDDIPIDEIHTPLLSHSYIDLSHNFDKGMQDLVTAIQKNELPNSPTLRDALSDDLTDKVTLQVDFNNTDADKVVDVIKGLLDKGVRSIKLENG